MRLIILLTLFWSSIIAFDGWASLFRPGKMLDAAEEYWKRGDYDSAIRVADSVANLSTNDLTKLRACELLIKSYDAVGDFPACERSYSLAKSLFENSRSFTDIDDPLSPSALTFSTLMLNSAQFQIAMGHYENAARDLLYCNFIPGSEGDIRRLGVLASLNFRKENPLKAIEILDQAILLAENSPSLPVLLQNRGYINTSLRNYQNAISDFKHALDFQSGSGKAVILSNMAIPLALAGYDQEALDAINQALQIFKCEGSSRDDYLTALRKKGEVLLITSRGSGKAIKAGVKDMSDYISGKRESIPVTLAGMPPKMRLNFWTKEKPQLSRAFIVGAHDPELMMDLALLRREISLPVIEHSSDSFDDYYKNLTSQSLAERLDSNEAVAAFILYPDPEGTEKYAVIVMLPDGKCTFIDLFDADFLLNENLIADRLSVADAIIPEDPELKNLLYEDSEIADLIWQPILATLPDKITTIHFAPEGIFHLWGIENMPFSGKEKYNVIRHFSLFNIDGNNRDKNLKDPENSGMLIIGGLDYDSPPSEDICSSTASDNSAYKELSRALNADGSHKIFSSLPGTRREINEIHNIVDDATLLSSVSEDLLKQHSNNYSIIHLATHGYSLDCGIGSVKTLPSDSLAIDISLLRSGLALSGANVLGSSDNGDDGILSAREICNLEMGNIDLIVMSACQTAQGFITDENASGLIRALKIAGVKSIVASLWEVDDKTTALFMAAFHRELANGASASEAFGIAQKYVAEYSVPASKRAFSPATLSGKIIDSSPTFPYSAPWYWAPFILIDP